MSSSASRRSNLACWPLVDPSSISASNWRMRSRWNPGISSARPANAYWPTDGAVGCRTWRNRTTQLASTSRRASHGRLVDMPAHRHDGRRIANRRRRHPFEAHRRNTTVGTGWWLFAAKVPGEHRTGEYTQRTARRSGKGAVGTDHRDAATPRIRRTSTPPCHLCNVAGHRPPSRGTCVGNSGSHSSVSRGWRAPHGSCGGQRASLHAPRTDPPRCHRPANSTSLCASRRMVKPCGWVSRRATGGRRLGRRCCRR